MAFRLDVAAISALLIQAARDELQAAEAASRETLDPDTVHRLRKHTKRLRAWLRLLRPSLPRQPISEIENNLRATAHTLAHRREADVLPQTLRQLAERVDESERMQRLAEAESLASSLVPPTTGAGAGAGDGVDTLPDRLTGIRQQIEGLPLQAVDASLLEAGWFKTYRSARRRARALRHDATAEHLHEFRKRCKALAYQGELLSPLWPSLGAFADALDPLNDRLGEHHDLAVLLELLAERPEPAQPWVRLARERQHELEREIGEQAGRLFRARARRFMESARQTLLSQAA